MSTTIAIENTLNVWRDCQDDPPPVDVTVLVYIPYDDEPVWPGWFDGENWFRFDRENTKKSKYFVPDAKLWSHIPIPDYE